MARLLALPLVAPAAFAAAPSDPAANTRGQLAEQIMATQSRQGPYAQALIEPFTTLSLMYGEDGNHALAIATIEQALQVVRANFGLRSLEQLPLIRQRILNEESRGNVAGAWELERQLLELARAHPEDLRAAGVFRELGDKRMVLLERYLAGDYLPQITLGCYYGTYGNCSSGSKRVASQAILQEAQLYYVDAIGVLTRNELQSSDEVRELELELVRSSYFYGRYATGRDSLTRLVSYANVAEPPSARADALLRLADWDLSFEKLPQALVRYEEARALLQREGFSETAIAEVLSPPIPVALPTFLPSLLQTEGEPNATGYVEVAFDISRFGSSRRIEVLDSDASSAAQERVVKLIARNRFRPRLTDGEFGRTSRVVVRYFVNEQPQPL